MRLSLASCRIRFELDNNLRHAGIRYTAPYLNIVLRMIARPVAVHRNFKVDKLCPAFPRHKFTLLRIQLQDAVLMLSVEFDSQYITPIVLKFLKAAPFVTHWEEQKAA